MHSDNPAMLSIKRLIFLIFPILTIAEMKVLIENNLKVLELELLILHQYQFFLLNSRYICFVQTLKTANEAIYFSKSTEIAILGCFESLSGPEWATFNEVILAVCLNLEYRR